MDENAQSKIQVPCLTLGYFLGLPILIKRENSRWMFRIFRVAFIPRWFLPVGTGAHGRWWW
jgi:hypothetical protein